ncbi:hypothetical protein GCM10023310_52280 [Paenibacillus vulneris]|uniref:Uncharacterized protein n=1 Tax=Paenibacillus vulneris TaxID=1133364 RepID=A0ABW3UN97_9BACL
MNREHFIRICKGVLLGCSIIFLTGTSYLFPLVGSGEVTAVGIAGGLPSAEKPEPFNITNPKEKAVIFKITEWLNQSEAVDGPIHFGRHGYPNVLEFKLTNNRMVMVEPAYRCKKQRQPDGSLLRQCNPVKGEIIVTTPNYKRVRYKSPLLYHWLQEGWTREERRNPNQPVGPLIEKDLEENRSFARQLGTEVQVAAHEGKLPGFAGSYIDTEAGQLFVGLIDGYEDTRQGIIRMAAHPELLQFFDAQFTEEELKAQMTRLNAELPSLQKKGFQVHDYGISIRLNRLEVNVPEGNEKTLRLLTQVIAPEYLKINVTKPWKYMTGNHL